MSLMASRHGKFQGKVFYLAGGRRHHVLHPEWLEENGYAFADIEWMDAEDMDAIPLGAPAPRQWAPADFRSPPCTTMAALREIITSQLSGQGIEFGAGSNPLPAPLHCNVRYADRIQQAHFIDQYHEGQEADTVTPDLNCEIGRIEGVPDGSLDFVLACHVIEHTRNPLLAFQEVYAKLRRGGRFVLVVPDKLQTFDRERELTSLEHIILDFEKPSRDRDVWHYLEFYTKPFPQPVEELYGFIGDKFARAHDIHYHTWHYESFAEMVAYAQPNIAPWSEVWSHPTPVANGGTEFYFVLTK